jgi:hypothetical protein
MLGTVSTTEGFSMAWPPHSEAEILTALELGEVTESGHLDFKATVGDTSSARKETAKDLASFAVDGGVLLIGVREDKQARTFHAEPIDLHDVVERIEQIAGNRIDPPLVVRPREIPSDTDGLGYVWVDIPASPDAPHMVDGRYYGRGVRTNRQLTDAEVLRLHRTRQDDQGRIQRALDDLQARDPYASARPNAHPSEEPVARFGHLYAVAVPRSAGPGIAERLVWDGSRELIQFTATVENTLSSSLRPYGPHPSGFDTVLGADSISLTDLNRGDVTSEGREAHGFNVRVFTNGSIGYTVTRVSTSEGNRSPDLILDDVLLATTWRLVEWTRLMATATGYSGSWDLGIRATDLQGKRSRVLSAPQYGGGGAYDREEYERVTTVPGLELQYVGKVAKELVQPILRAIGSWEYWSNLVDELP